MQTINPKPACIHDLRKRNGADGMSATPSDACCVVKYPVSGIGFVVLVKVAPDFPASHTTSHAVSHTLTPIRMRRNPQRSSTAHDVQELAAIMIGQALPCNGSFDRRGLVSSTTPLFSASESLHPPKTQQRTDGKADRRNLQAEIDGGMQDRNHRCSESDSRQIAVGATTPAAAQTYCNGQKNRGKTAHRPGDAKVEHPFKNRRMGSVVTNLEIGRLEEWVEVGEGPQSPAQPG